jgi:hypothetical protein
MRNFVTGPNMVRRHSAPTNGGNDEIPVRDRVKWPEYSLIRHQTEYSASMGE